MGHKSERGEVAAVGRRGAAAVVVTVIETDVDTDLVIVVVDEVKEGVVRRVVDDDVDDDIVDARTVGVGTTTSVSTITPAH